MNSLRWGYVSLILATLFWGGNYVLGKVLSGAIPPLSLTFARWFPALLILLALFYRPTKTALPKLLPHWKILTLLGVLGIVTFPATLYQGLKTTSALNASLYLAVVPVLVQFLNLALFKERIKPMILAGAVLSFVGVLWLLSQGQWQRLATLDINQGDLWAMGSALSWAVYCSLIRFRPAGLPNTVFLTTLTALAMLAFSPFFLWELARESATIWQNLTALQWLGIGYLIIAPSILSYACWNHGIAIVGSAKAAVMTNFTPLFAALFGILLLGEQVQLFHWVSAGLIGAGVLLCHQKSA